ncbi:MAG TPA: DUF819 family protein [Candidatus Omnitrophota bacterium]|nr:DUF819 family protein [Candidatus Omnitrophota bacterium]HPS37197.1 DUF819 family protein [Candidatus Omnitrophota bacterium]
MIRNPLGILGILVLTEAVVLCFTEHARFKRFFQFPPSMFWIYFLPMVFSTFNIIPQQSEVYPKIGAYVLPASLILLLISADLKAIFKLGVPALGMMFAGTFGVLLGAPVVLWIFKPWLSADAWSGFAALSASWTGGSANMIAVKEALGTPDAVFLPMVVVDTLVAYSWMGILILLEGVQVAYDKWNRSDRTVVEELHRKIAAASVSTPGVLRLEFILLILFAGAFGAGISVCGARWLVGLTGIPQNTLLILIASTLGIAFSFTPVKKLESFGASRIGYILLYFVLTSIGARASLASIVSAPLLIVAGFVWVLIHALFLFAVSRLTRTPLCLVATASQANIGGPASAPVVAAVYEPALAPVGLLLGVLGNVMGTYCGLLCAQLCRLF